MIRALAVFILLWMFTSFFVVGFQCHLPDPWRSISNTCIDIKAFWAYYHIMNALTDIALIILPWIILSNLQVEARRKAVIIGCFAARIMSVSPLFPQPNPQLSSPDPLTQNNNSVVAITIVQLYYLLKPAPEPFDLTYSVWRIILLGEVVLTLSLVTACIPYLKPFMEALETGMMRANGGGPSHGHGFGYGHRSSRKYGPLSHISHSNAHPNTNNHHNNNHSKSGRTIISPLTKGVRMDTLGYSGEKEHGGRGGTTTVSAKGHQRVDSDEDSQTSQSRIIRKTVGWSVTEEPTVMAPAGAHLEYHPIGRS
ncbi:MAG: hypothetical protein Q9183_005532 [Haloplaca sp. 2 TL-2023]